MRNSDILFICLCQTQSKDNYFGHYFVLFYLFVQFQILYISFQQIKYMYTQLLVNQYHDMNDLPLQNKEQASRSIVLHNMSEDRQKVFQQVSLPHYPDLDASIDLNSLHSSPVKSNLMVSEDDLHPPGFIFDVIGLILVISY